MTKEEYRKNIDEVIYLASCAVNDVTPDKERVKKISLPELYKAADSHMLTSITAFALESAGIYDSAFTQAKGKAIRKIAAMDIDKILLFEKLEKEKIWYMPLKGTVIKELYPSFGMRQMSDFDILFDSSYNHKIKEIMLDLGFTTEHFGQGNHDVYFKQPVSNFEMHTGLFSPNHKKEIYDYYRDVRSRLIKDDNNEYGYHFSNEDLYIYVTAHEYKHYSSGGTGLRSVLDTYVFMKKLGDQLDHDYIAAETEKLDIREFEQNNRRLAMNLFGGKALTEQNQQMLEYIIFSGTYGTIENSVQNQLNQFGNDKKGKTKYVLQRLFPSMDNIRTFYPFFYKHKILLPALFFYRIGKSLTVSRKKISTELKHLRKNKS